MRIAREVALYNQGGIQNGIDGAEDRASKVATSFITRVSESEGIKVHNADDLTDYIQINSNGVDLVNDNVSIANFGESARVGKVTSSRFMVNADSLEAYDDSNEKYFEVTPSGMTYGAHTVADTDYADQAEADAISTASADATTKANAAAQTATNFITTDSTGIKVHNTNDSSNYTHIGSGGMDVYQGGDLSASFGSTRAQVGKANTGHTIIEASGMQIYGNDGTLQLANIGYGEGQSGSGTTASAPYFTFGTRGNNNLVGNYSFTAGRGLLATGSNNAAFGSYNETTGTGIFCVGNGTSSQRSNALCLTSGGALITKGYMFSNANADSSGGHLLGVLKVTGAMAGVLPVQVTHSMIRDDMEVVSCVLSNPSAQAGDWTVTTSDGKAIISGATTGAHTDITLYLSSML